MRHYFSSNQVRLLEYVFTDRNKQSEWLKRDESNSLKQDSDLQCIRKLSKSWRSIFKELEWSSKEEKLVPFFLHLDNLEF